MKANKKNGKELKIQFLLKIWYLQMLVALCLHLPDFCQDEQELIAMK